MRKAAEFLVRIILLALIWFIWWWALNAPLPGIINLTIIVGGVLLVIPVVYIGREILDKNPTTSRAAWITTFVHYALGIFLGTALIRAIDTHRDWSGWLIPVPLQVGLFLCKRNNH